MINGPNNLGNLALKMGPPESFCSRLSDTTEQGVCQVERVVGPVRKREDYHYQDEG